MLWLDAEPEQDLAVRLTRAAAYYAEKYGRRANLCVVHPDMIGEQVVREVGGLAVRTRKDVLRDHVWIGVEDQVRGDD